MIKKIVNLLMVLAVFVGVAMPVESVAQSATTTTYVTAGIDKASSSNRLQVASVTGATTQWGGFVDGEYFTISGVDTSNNILSIKRGAGGVQTSHLVNAPVYLGPTSQAGPFQATDGTVSYPAPGPCVRASIAYLPVINMNDASIWDCPAQVSAAGASATSGTATATPYVWQLASRRSVRSNTLYRPVVNVNDTMRPFDYFIDYVSMSAARTVTLPAITSAFGVTVIIKHSAAANTLTVQAGVGQSVTTIGTASTTLQPGGILRLIGAAGVWETW